MTSNNDPANIFIVTDGHPSTRPDKVPGLYVSTRYDGRHWPERLCDALNPSVVRSRWGSSKLLANIITVNISCVAKGATPTSAANVELGTTAIASERPVITVDPYSKIVAFAALGQETDMIRWYGHMSFEAYTEQERADYPENKSALVIFHLHTTPHWNRHGHARDYIVIARSLEDAHRLISHNSATHHISGSRIAMADPDDKMPRIIFQDREV